MKRILAAVAAVLIIGAIVAGATSGASAAVEDHHPTDHHSSVVPRPGDYEGRDLKRKHIRFHVNHEGWISTFRIDHVELGSTWLKENASFTHVCQPVYNHFCAHGHWTDHEHVSGGWRMGNGVATIQYTAHWVEDWSSH